MDRRIAGEEGAEARDGGEGVIVEAEQVGDEALVEVDAGGVNGAAVEGLEGAVLEALARHLGLFNDRLEVDVTVRPDLSAFTDADLCELRRRLPKPGGRLGVALARGAKALGAG